MCWRGTSFNTCSSCEEQLQRSGQLPETLLVSIHAPLARSNSGLLIFNCRVRGFNTCSSCEEQLRRVCRQSRIRRFNTCSSCEEQLRCCAIVNPRNRFQYMLLLRGATLSPPESTSGALVSIHAPLARSNRRCAACRWLSRGFNTCSSCEEQRAQDVFLSLQIWFQYMLLLRGATGRADLRDWSRSFNTCSSCEEQRSATRTKTTRTMFQYMLLLRGATGWQLPALRFSDVSIHAPLARSNENKQYNAARQKEFQYMLLLRGATISFWRSSAA